MSRRRRTFFHDSEMPKISKNMCTQVIASSTIFRIYIYLESEELSSNFFLICLKMLAIYVSKSRRDVRSGLGVIAHPPFLVYRGLNLSRYFPKKIVSKNV